MLEDYKDHVRKLPCLVCDEAADAHHLVSVGMGRKRALPRWEDYTIVPLCRNHHQELHQVGLTVFQNNWQINLVKKALLILAQWIFEND